MDTCFSYIIFDDTRRIYNRNKWIDMKTKVKTPKYYDGKNGYTAREVVDNFDLPYHLGTAVTYILRSYKKHERPNEDLQKAIDHLTFELEKLEEQNKWVTEQYNRNRSPEDWVM